MEFKRGDHNRINKISLAPMPVKFTEQDTGKNKEDLLDIESTDSYWDPWRGQVSLAKKKSED